MREAVSLPTAAISATSVEFRGVPLVLLGDRFFCLDLWELKGLSATSAAGAPMGSFRHSCCISCGLTGNAQGPVAFQWMGKFS